MSRKNDYSFVRVITTLQGGYRNRGIGHNFEDMEQAASFMDELCTVDFSNVKQVRIIPRAVAFTNPKQAAKGLDGATSGNRW